MAGAGWKSEPARTTLQRFADLARAIAGFFQAVYYAVRTEQLW